MASIAEKRVYDDHEDPTELVVAAELGVLSVAVTGDAVGEFRVVHRCTARDVAARGNAVAVATDDDVLRGPDFHPTGFGPAVAVGVGDGLLAAGPDGRVARRGEDWRTLGRAGDVRAIDGDLVAAADGVYRAGYDLQAVGLDDARDVAADGPLAATADGVYRLGNGWREELAGEGRVVAADGERAHAATAGGLYGRTGGEWRPLDSPADAPIAEIAHGEAVYAVTVGGTVLVDAGDGWRSRALGVGGVGGLAVRG